ncbi:MAG: hypothetical protein SW833_00670 [Cyanobacteriota bacterium]|nr:hypothetical protein [Cyanobacteriota bacterium]
MLKKGLAKKGAQMQLGWAVEAFKRDKTDAHQAHQGFRRFGRDRFSVLGYNKKAIAQVNLENSISSAF